MPDGTRVAPRQLRGIVVRGHRIYKLPNVPVEKPLVSVYPEFDFIFAVRVAISKSFSSLLSSNGKYTEKSFFENTSYTNKVKKQMFTNDYHSFPESVTAFKKKWSSQTNHRWRWYKAK